MDRAIKFRAWDGKIMHYQYLIAGGNYCNALTILQEDYAKSHYKMKEWKVMQFTGLYDCEGKEIYLGDIVQATFQMRKQEPVEFISPVDFSIQWGATVEGDDVYSLGRCRNIKVLGNLYEHPNLLNNES